LFDRPFDEIEIATEARDAGYRGLVLKSIFSMNADRVELVRKVVPGIELFGSIVFNHTVGGLNPSAMRAAIGFGAKVAWLPTVHAQRHVEFFGMPTYPWLGERNPSLSHLLKEERKPLRLLDDEGKLVKEATEIIELAADAGVVIGTGHVSAEEIFPTLIRAKEIGFKKMICTHVGWHATAWSRDEMMRMADLGATLEFTVNPCMPARQQASTRSGPDTKNMGAAIMGSRRPRPSSPNRRRPTVAVPTMTVSLMTCIMILSWRFTRHASDTGDRNHGQRRLYPGWLPDRLLGELGPQRVGTGRWHARCA
jgi:hypothetical protein